MYVGAVGARSLRAALLCGLCETSALLTLPFFVSWGDFIRIAKARKNESAKGSEVADEREYHGTEVRKYGGRKNVGQKTVLETEISESLGDLHSLRASASPCFKTNLVVANGHSAPSALKKYELIF
jgi:hypothetical protein